MGYKITSLLVKNFKCFDNEKFYRFSFDETKNPIILSGPNGFGKTTFFDAVELIFTKNITRLHRAIEDGRTNLGGNILLNDTGKSGILVLNLKDEEHGTLSIVATIDYSQVRLTIEDSLKYYVTNEVLDQDNAIEVFIESIPSDAWKQSLFDFDKLNYKPDHFAVYYYVSQAESVHFLKKNINERKSSINTLLKTDTIDGYIKHIEGKLIGINTTRGGVLINDAIATNEKAITDIVSLLKSKMGNEDIQSVKYEQLLNYGDNLPILPWDVSDITFDSQNTAASLSKLIHDLQSLYNFVLNKEDYEFYRENEKVKKLINKRSIEDFCRYHPFISNGSVDRQGIQQSSSDRQKTINVYARSKFFRSGFTIPDFNKNDLSYIKEANENLILSDINDIEGIVNKLKEISKRLSDKQKVLGELNKARQELRKFVDKLDKTGSCPYCASQFENNDELETAFTALSTEIASSRDSASAEYDTLLAELKDKLSSDCERVLAYINGLNEDTVRTFSQSVTAEKQFADSTERVNIVEKILAYFRPNDSWLSLNDSEKPSELECLMQGRIKAYTNPNFDEDLRKYDFQGIVERYRDILNLEQSKLNQESVEKKIAYLRYRHSLSANTEIAELRAKLKDALVKQRKLKPVREKLDKLKGIYRKSIDAHTNQVSEKLRVPLLIYSCKILQNYQDGLGVFINKEGLRFVSNGDTKHDILNTFSSGQLSGFVLSFLFAMNKQYITKSNDDISFILVDDPVQTMDDINVASLIEVLRNDFSGKQIILSTHETDKENYILYKFLKYKRSGQSFNVKERLYT